MKNMMLVSHLVAMYLPRKGDLDNLVQPEVKVTYKQGGEEKLPKRK